MTPEALRATLPEWAAVGPEYARWRAFMEERVEFSLKVSPIHTKNHCGRVILHALTLAHRLGLDEDDRNALGMAGAFHDSRRQDDWMDVGHGRRAADYYRAFCDETGRPMDLRVYGVMAHHDRPDPEGEKALADLPGGVLLYRIFKDADALDRWRLGPGGLDPKYLRTGPAKELLDFSRALVTAEGDDWKGERYGPKD